MRCARLTPSLTTEKKQSKKCAKLVQKLWAIRPKQEKRGTSPRVSKGSAFEPSFTVGLMPRLSHRQRCVQSSFASFARRSRLFLSHRDGIDRHASLRAS